MAFIQVDKADDIALVRKNILCGTHTIFSYPALQQKKILLPALHSYLILTFNAL